MEKINPYIIVLLLLSLTLVGLLHLWAPVETAPTCVLKAFPLVIGEWRGEDQPFENEEWVYSILETRDLLMRKYTNPQGESVLLFIVYSAARRRAFHPPEICYVGTGGKLLYKGLEDIEIAKPGEEPSAFRINKLVVGYKENTLVAWYWFSAGGRMTDSYYRQQLYILWNKMMRRECGGSLIRVSSAVVVKNEEAVGAKEKEFIKALTPVAIEFFSRQP